MSATTSPSRTPRQRRAPAGEIDRAEARIRGPRPGRGRRGRGSRRDRRPRRAARPSTRRRGDPGDSVIEAILHSAGDPGCPPAVRRAGGPDVRLRRPRRSSSSCTLPRPGSTPAPIGAPADPDPRRRHAHQPVPDDPCRPLRAAPDTDRRGAADGRAPASSSPRTRASSCSSSPRRSACSARRATRSGRSCRSSRRRSREVVADRRRPALRLVQPDRARSRPRSARSVSRRHGRALCRPRAGPSSTPIGSSLVGYALVGLALIADRPLVSPRGRGPAGATRRSRGASGSTDRGASCVRLSALFALDAFAGGLIVAEPARVLVPPRVRRRARRSSARSSSSPTSWPASPRWRRRASRRGSGSSTRWCSRTCRRTCC